MSSGLKHSLIWIGQHWRPNRCRALFANLDTQDADPMVAGAFGHSRIYEGLFGGVSIDLMHQQSLPVLMSSIISARAIRSAAARGARPQPGKSLAALRPYKKYFASCCTPASAPNIMPSGLSCTFCCSNNVVAMSLPPVLMSAPNSQSLHEG